MSAADEAAVTKGRSGRTTSGKQPTREKLMLAAERLVAERGVDAVSTRQIASEAGVELGSIHHHFKTKDQLLLSAREWRVDMVDQLLRDMIEQRSASDAHLTVQDLADLMVLPLVELATGQSSARNYPAFLRSLSSCPRMAFQLAYDTSWAIRLLDVYAKACPDIAESERRRRFAVTANMVLNSVANPSLGAWLLNTTPGSGGDLTQSLLACVAGALGAPDASNSK